MDRKARLSWFEKTSNLLPETGKTGFNLLLNAKVDTGSFAKMEETCADYLKASLGVENDLSAKDFLSSLRDSDLPNLANRTPNGAVLPKKELEEEFNNFHFSVSSWFKTLGLDDTIYKMFCPITLRVMSGSTTQALSNRPYATNKMHADLWAGDPADGVNVIIAIFGDIENTGVDFFEPPHDFEEKFMKHLDSYDEGHEYTKNCPRYDYKTEVGDVTFFDSIVPHKTARKGGECRGTIQFNLRRETAPEVLEHIENICDQGKLVNFVSLQDWYAIGDTKFLTFSDTLADAKKGIFPDRPYSDTFYSFVDSL